MTNTDVAGDDRTEPMPERGPIKYRATLGSKSSRLFTSRQEARDWIASRREATGDHDSGSMIDEVEV